MEEEEFIENLVTTLLDQIKYDHVFIIAFKQTDNRMSFFLRSIIPLPEKMFRPRRCLDSSGTIPSGGDTGEEAERIHMQVILVN